MFHIKGLYLCKQQMKLLKFFVLILQQCVAFHIVFEFNYTETIIRYHGYGFVHVMHRIFRISKHNHQFFQRQWSPFFIHFFLCVCMCVYCKVWTGHCNPEHSLIRSYMSTDLFNNRKIYSASFVFVTIHSASFCSRKEKRNSKFSHPIQHHFLCLDILINFLERFSSSEQTKLYNTNTLTIKLFKMLEFNKYLSLTRKRFIYKRGFKHQIFWGTIGVIDIKSFVWYAIPSKYV